MLLFDELAAALQDLPSDRYGAVTRALFRLGIHVSKDSIKSNNDSGLHLFIKLHFEGSGDIRESQEARFHESTRSWQLSGPPTSGLSAQSNGYALKRPKPGRTGDNRAENGYVTESELLTLEDTVPDSDNDSNNDGAADSVPPRHAPDWLDQLPQTSHLEFIKSRDWAATELGPIEQWPAPLRLMTRKMLADPRAANLYWGKGRVSIYNEEFCILAQNRHPFMMGATAADAMPLTWPFLQPMFDEVERSGIAFSMPEFEMTVEKSGGFVEEAWYDGIFSPIYDDNRKLHGFYNSGFEVTAPKMLQRRTQMLHKLGSTPNLQQASIWSHITDSCKPFERDIPLLAVYSAVSEETPHLSRCTIRLEATLGIERGHPAIPDEVELHETNDGLIEALRRSLQTGKPVILGTSNDGSVPDIMKQNIQWRGHGKPATHIAVLPMFTTGLIAGFVIAALNPLRPYDEEHEQFVNDFRRVMTALLDSTVSFEQAQARERQLTQELTTREKYTATIAENVSVGIYNISSEGAITWANSKYYEITGLSADPADARNLSFADCLHEDDREKGIKAFHRCRLEQVSESGELRLSTRWPPETQMEEVRWILFSHAPHIVNDAFRGIIGCVTDISHVKWAEKLQKESAEAANIARVQRERHIDLTSHELRNPLSAVMQSADDICTLAQRAKETLSNPKDVLESIESMLDSAQTILLCSAHSQRIVDDILTYSKLESSLLTMTPVLINPLEIVRVATEMFKNEAAAADIDLDVEIRRSFEDLDVKLFHGDPTRITQIVVNLLTNAIKFTKTSKQRIIRVYLGSSVVQPPTNMGDVTWFPSDSSHRDTINLKDLGNGEQVYLVMAVEDTGKGMTTEEMSKLFQRFSQTNRLTHVTYGGSGLGLFLSREITELHGGQIGCISTPGQGSTFTFCVQCAKASPAEVASYTGSTVRRRSSVPLLKPKPSQTRLVVEAPTMSTIPASPNEPTIEILLVEDNLINQKVLSKQLRRSGWTVNVANHGVEALDFIKTSRYWRDNNNKGAEISFILLDVEMPVMGGLECAQRIRQDEKDDLITKHLTIIATTANARAEQVQAAYDAGMDDFLAKPFKVADVMKMAAKYTASNAYFGTDVSK